MKLCFVFLVCFVCFGYGEGLAQDQKVTLDLDNATLFELFNSINEQTGLRFLYNADYLEKINRVNVHVKQEKVSDVLNQVFKGSLLSYEYNGEVIFILDKASQVQQTEQAPDLITVKGKVTDEKGNPMPGVTIVVYGTSQGLATNVDGHYTIMVPADGILRFSFVGYKTEDISVKGKTTINVGLKPEAANLEEVTVVAFGTQKKESVVSSITTVRPMDLKSSSSDLTASFAGKIAGIVGWQTGGAPGALTEDEMNTKFYIRGISSSNGTSEPLVLIDGVESSRLDLARMAPEDIESFSVLKDASATAMYGARGANGVILVTTKKGEAGSVYTTVRYEAVASMPTREIEIVDPKTYMRMYNEAYLTRTPNGTPPYSLTRIERTGDPKYPSWVYPANDWYDILFKDMSINHRVGVNVRGGSELMQYYASVNYNNDKGMLKTDRLNQFDVNIKNSTLTSRINLNVNLNQAIRLLVNTSISVDKYHGPLADVTSAYAMAFEASPVDFAPIYPADKEYAWPHLRFGNVPGGPSANIVNPYAEIQKGYVERGRYSATTRAEYIHNLASLVKGLELRASVAFSKTGYEVSRYTTGPYYYSMNPETDYDFEKNEHHLQSIFSYPQRRTLEADGSSAQTSVQWVYEGRLLHTAAWGGVESNLHQTSLTAVFQAQQSSVTPIDDLFNGLEHRNLSFSMRGSYGFHDRYFVEASFGYNGSERFTKNNRMGFFPSVGAAWLVSKENFLLNQNWISFLKLRASWGKVGNDGIIEDPRFVYMPQIGNTQTNYGPNPKPGNDDPFYRKQIKNYGDPDVKWEISEQVNLGLETRFFKDKLEINADVYQEIRHNIIDYRSVIPANMGIELNPLDNIGKVRSRGIDLSAKVQHSFNKDFWVILNGTFTYNKAVYKELEEAIDKPYWQRRVGHELSQPIGYIAEGLFHDQAEIDNSPQANTGVMPGDIRYRDVNGDNKIDIDDAVYIGFPETPRIIYGFSGFINYKNWEFNFAFQGSGKRGFFLDPAEISPFGGGTYRDTQSSSSRGDRALLKAIAESHWTEDCMDNRPFWPRLSIDNIVEHNKQEDWYLDPLDVRKSTYFMRECRFLRCTSLELAYNLPLKIRQKLRMQNVKLFARANNPFMFTNFKIWDVELGESGFKYPIQKTYALGVNISF